MYVCGFALSNLARLALTNGDLGVAERRLAEARVGVKEPRGTERIGWLEIEGRILLAHGRARDALKVLDDALALARASVLHAQEWSLLVARAEALGASGRTSEAIDSLRAAEDVLDEAILLVPLGEGRGAFAGGRYVARALSSGSSCARRRLRRPRASPSGRRRVCSRARSALYSRSSSCRLETAHDGKRRSARSARPEPRSTRTPANDWKLPSDALGRAVSARAARERDSRSALERAMAIVGARHVDPRRGSGDLEVDVYRDLEGYLAVARDGDKAETYRLPDPGRSLPEALARALLDPIAGLLERSQGRALVVRPYGAWRSVDVHALPWRGEPLLARLPVVYSIGLGRTERAADGAPVVIGYSTGDLPAAFAEARLVARALDTVDGVDAGGPAARVLLRDEATSRAVGDALRGAGRLHYAGHGVFAGEEGWESALRSRPAAGSPLPTSSRSFRARARSYSPDARLPRASARRRGSASHRPSSWRARPRCSRR